jgi:hypothetical protein
MTPRREAVSRSSSSVSCRWSATSPGFRHSAASLPRSLPPRRRRSSRRSPGLRDVLDAVLPRVGRPLRTLPPGRGHARGRLAPSRPLHSPTQQPLRHSSASTRAWSRADGGVRLGARPLRADPGTGRGGLPRHRDAVPMNGWTGGQWSVVRFAFRLYLFIHFVSLGPWAARSCSLATGSLPADVEPLRAGLPELPLLLGRAHARDSLRLRRRRTRGAVCARLARPVGCRGVWYVAACLFGETR